MPRGHLTTLLAALLAAWTTAAAQPTTGTTRPAATRRPVPLTRDSIEEAQERAAGFLIRSQDKAGTWPTKGIHADATTALALRGLFSAGWSYREDVVKRALARLAEHKAHCGYCAAVRCLVLQEVSWQDRSDSARKAYRRELVDMVHMLTAIKAKPSAEIDRALSRQQRQAMLWIPRALIEADRQNLEIPHKAWELIWQYWRQRQNADGGWGPWQGAVSDAITTAGGLQAVQATWHRMHAGKDTMGGAAEKNTAAARASRWLAKQFAGPKGIRLDSCPDLARLLYALQRCARETEVWHLGDQHLFWDGNAALLRAQKPDGSWPGPDSIEATALALGLLRGAEITVVLSRLKYPGDWNNRPRSLPHLRQYIDRKAPCRRFFSQIIDVDRPVGQWRTGGVLVITGSRGPQFSPAQLEHLQLFLQRGGLIFSIPEGDGAAFTKGMRAVYARICPGLPLVPTKKDHPLYHMPWLGGSSARAEFSVIHNGVRPLVVHAGADLTLPWQLRRSITQAWAYESATSVWSYAKYWFWRTREWEVGPWPAPVTAPLKRIVTLARLKHTGNWDPEPLAYERFSRLLQAQTGVGLKVLTPVALADLPKTNPPIATLTGTGKLVLSNAEKAALKQYVAGGGTLVIDAAGGDKEFAESAQAALIAMHGKPGTASRSPLRRLPPTAPLFAVPGYKIEHVDYTALAANVFRSGDRPKPLLQAVQLGPGQGGRVLFSREDLTAGLLGATGQGIAGYSPKSAYEIMRNVVLSTMGDEMPVRKPDKE